MQEVEEIYVWLLHLIKRERYHRSERLFKLFLGKQQLCKFCLFLSLASHCILHFEGKEPGNQVLKHSILHFLPNF